MRANPLTETETPTTRTRYSRGEWEVVQCSRTGMVFLANPPDYSRLVDEFAWEKTFLEERARRRKSEPVFAFFSQRLKSLRLAVKKTDRITKIAVGIAREMSPADGCGTVTLVDVGCGGGMLSAQIVSHCVAAGIDLAPVGIEISRTLAGDAETRLSAFGGRCVQAPALDGLRTIPEGTVDIIVLASYLEHELHPLSVLQECRRILSGHGRIIIKVPNFACWNRTVRQDRWCGFRYPDHVNYFTPETLRIVVANAGLRIVRMSWWDRFPTNDSMYAVVGG